MIHESDYSSIGEWISTFDFKVKTDNLKDFEDGVIPWADLEDSKVDLFNLSWVVYSNVLNQG